ncbi:MAG: carbonic anhydrase [Hyphomicrobiales bacterium]|nr:carbonic anhydrase [Hyphomicrobiales bacterium]
MTDTAFPESLMRGYESFLGHRFSAEQQRFRGLAEAGQKPEVMLIGCCDSRVSPEVIFDAGPGEIFVVRNVANLVPPYLPNDDLHGTSAALEFGVMGLRVAHVVVMGHASCGGIRSYVETDADPYQRPLSPGDFIGKWMSLIAPAFASLGPRRADETVAAYADRLGHLAVIQSLANLRSFPCVETLEKKGRLHLHGAFFGIADGRLQVLDEATGMFHPVAEAAFNAVMAQPHF